MKFLTDEQLAELLPAETSSFPSPVPTQIVSSDEYLPVPQTEKQREVEARLKEMSDRLARRQGVSRRRFFQTASGMAASFVAMNQVFGPIFDASVAEAATPDMAADRAQALVGPVHHRRPHPFPARRHAADRLCQNAQRIWQARLEQGADRQIRPSTTSNTPITSKRSTWTATPRWRCCRTRPRMCRRTGSSRRTQVFETRAKVNKQAGSRRMMAHFTITPGQPGWLDKVDRGDRGLQARFVEGLHRRRQHPQGTRRAIPGTPTTRS